MMVPGELVFGTLVIVANIKLLVSSFLINWVMIVLILASVLLYIIFYIIISHCFEDSEDFGTFYMLMSAPQTYFTLMLFTFMFVLVDTGVHYCNYYINKWYLATKDIAISEQKKKDQQSKSVIKRKVTSYKSKS